MIFGCRARVHALEKELASRNLSGLVETNAGVRSCMIEYDQRKMPLPTLLNNIREADAAIGDVHVSVHGWHVVPWCMQSQLCILSITSRNT